MRILKHYAKEFTSLVRLCDVFLLLLSFSVAYALRYGVVPLPILALHTQYQIFLPACLIGWIYFSNRFQLYASKRMVPFSREAFDIGKAVTICIAIAAIPSFFLRDEPLSRIFLVSLWQLQIGSLVLFRFVLRETLRYTRRRGYNYRQIVIVGRNDRADTIVKMVEESPELGMRILGFIDSANGKDTLRSFDNYTLLGNLDDLEAILREQVVDEVFVLLPIKSFYAEIEKILGICESVGVEAKISADLFNIRLAKMHVSLFGDAPLIDYYTGPRMSWQLLLKRLIDIAMSACLLILHAPLFALAAFAIKCTSRGPVFFKQPRVGYNGRTFNCLKFRTMVQNAEELRDGLMNLNEVDGPVFKIRNDPRITGIGRILRKASFDELPQLINVLRGDMSLVGPRPPLPGEVSQYDLSDLRRLSMRPGITCLWQVKGRNRLNFAEWMKLDQAYIDHWSLLLDLRILAQTIPTVLKGTGN